MSNKKFNSGSSLKKLRLELGLSQAGLSELSGCKQSMISSFELEKSSMSKNDLEKIQKILNDKKLVRLRVQRKKRYSEKPGKKIQFKSRKYIRMKRFRKTIGKRSKNYCNTSNMRK